MLSFDDIVRVTVDADAAVTAPAVFDTGLILGPSEVIPPEERVRAFDGIEAMAEAGFTDSMPEMKAARLYFSARHQPAALLVARRVLAGAADAEAPPETDETVTDAFRAVLDRTDAFYGVFVCDADSASVLALNAELMALDRFFLFSTVTGAPEEAAGPTALPAQLKATGSRRSLILYSGLAEDGAAVMGEAMGLSRAHPYDGFMLCYAALNGVTPSVLSRARMAALLAVNCNTYVTRGRDRSMLEKAASAHGDRYDTVMYLDRIAGELREVCLDLLCARNTRIPMTDTATALFFSALAPVLESWYERGILSDEMAWRGPDIGTLLPGDRLTHGYYLWADSYDRQTAADRAAHRAMPVTVCLALADSVESVVISLSVET